MSLLEAWIWPKVSDRKNAQFAITEAYCVAAAVAVITALFATVELMKGTSEDTGADAFGRQAPWPVLAPATYRPPCPKCSPD